MAYGRGSAQAGGVNLLTKNNTLSNFITYKATVLILFTLTDMPEVRILFAISDDLRHKLASCRDRFTMFYQQRLSRCELLCQVYLQKLRFRRRVKLMDVLINKRSEMINFANSH